jgi:hypothetical protein
MQITPLTARLLTVMAASMVTAAWVMGAASAKPTLVEFWHVGDDALSEKLADRIEAAFNRSPDFTLSSGRKSGTLVVRIPTNVVWKRQISKRGRALYTVEFSSTDGRNLGVRTGSCWDDALEKCAAQIINYAKIAARKIHQD